MIDYLDILLRLGASSLDIAAMPIPYGRASMHAIGMAIKKDDIPGLIPDIMRSERDGHNIYMRSHWKDCQGPILVDDLSQDSVKAMMQDLAVVLVVETSKGNFQAWCAMHDGQLPLLHRSALAKEVAIRYSGDIYAASGEQFGRIIGSQNHKPQANGFISCLHHFSILPPHMPNWGQDAILASQKRLEAIKKQDADIHLRR